MNTEFIKNAVILSKINDAYNAISFVFYVYNSGFPQDTKIAEDTNKILSAIDALKNRIEKTK